MLQPISSHVHIPDRMFSYYPFGNTPAHPLPLMVDPTMARRS
ncbi:hypothetical protein KIPB_016075, partial [Kipferlia bialata]|eukprot:g16075.t1